MQWIEKCLTSLSQSSAPTKIIVIDNASTDGTVAFIQQNFPEVELILSDKNLGFGAANNIGLRKALDENADYIFLLNQDAWVEPNTIENLIEVAEKNKEYGIVSPFHFDYEGRVPEPYFKEWVMAHYTKDLESDWNSGNTKEIYSTSFVHAACWLMPISTIKRVGGFDPLFFHYGEDNDYVQRTKFQNIKIGIVPSAKFYHLGTNEGLKDPKKNVSFLINQGIVLFKNPSASNMGALFLFFKQLLKVFSKGFNNPLSQAYRFNLTRLPKMMKSRLHQKSSNAYL